MRTLTIALSTKMLRDIIAGIAASGVMVCAAIQPAQAVTFEVLSGNRAASAEFTIVGGNLQVVLTNTSAADVLVPVDVLTAVFFDIAGNSSLSRTSALLTAGSAVFYDSAPAGGVVGGEWGYKTGLFGAPLGATQGISSSGLGLFGAADRFPGANLAPPSNGSLNGLEYGLLSAGDNSATGNSAILNSGGLIRNSVTFTFGALPGDFSLTSIGNVSFQYGTSLTEPNVPAIPEPEIYAMLAAGLGLMGFVARRRQRYTA